MADFSTEAELSIILPNRELASVRSQIEDALSDIPVGVDASSAGRRPQPRDPSSGRFRSRRGVEGRMLELIELAEQRNELLDDIKDSSGGGGGSNILPFAAGARLAGGGAAGAGILGTLGSAGMAGGALAGAGVLSPLLATQGLTLGGSILSPGASIGQLLGQQFAEQAGDGNILRDLLPDVPEDFWPEITVPDDLWPSSDVIANEINFEPLPAPDVDSLEREDPLTRFQPDRPDQTAFEIERRRQTRTDRLGEESLALNFMQMDAEIRDERINDQGGVLGEVKREVNNTMNDFADNLEREIERTLGTRVNINWRDL